MQLGLRWVHITFGSDKFELKFPELSQAGHFNVRAETEMDFLEYTYSFFSSNFLLLRKSVILRRKSIIHHKENLEKNPSGKNCIFSNFRAEIFFSSWTKKVTSQAEPSWKSFCSSYGSSQLGSDSSLTFGAIDHLFINQKCRKSVSNFMLSTLFFIN